MTDIVKEVQSASKKVYDTTMTYAQKIQNGILMPKVVWNRFNSIDKQLKTEREENQKFREDVRKILSK